jgi:hypothetical protein
MAYRHFTLYPLSVTTQHPFQWKCTRWVYGSHKQLQLETKDFHCIQRLFGKLTSVGIEQKRLLPGLFEFGVVVDKRPQISPPQTSTTKSFRLIIEEEISIPSLGRFIFFAITESNPNIKPLKLFVGIRFQYHIKVVFLKVHNDLNSKSNWNFSRYFSCMFSMSETPRINFEYIMGRTLTIKNQNKTKMA